MSEAILILGDSGSGKSSSIRTLNPDETLVINALGKELPFRGSRAKYHKDRKNLFVPALDGIEASSRAASKVIKIMRLAAENPKLKQIIIDDFQYIISSEYMERSGEVGYDKFADIGRHAYQIFQTAKSLREDLKVVILAHTDEVGTGTEKKIQMKTFGKMFRQNITPEGYFSVVLITDPEIDDIEEEGVKAYRFRTQTDGSDPVKSAPGMFPLYIPNDLQLVFDGMDKYYGEEETEEEPVS